MKTLLMRVKEFAEFARVSVRTIRRWMEKGMPYIVVGQVFLIDKDAAVEWMRKEKP